MQKRPSEDLAYPTVQDFDHNGFQKKSFPVKHAETCMCFAIVLRACTTSMSQHVT